MKSSSRDNTARKTEPILTGLLAWIVPGAGHAYLGRPVRAAVLFLVIHLMFWSGVAIGGVFTVNPRQKTWWSRAQLCTGVSGLVTYYRQSQTHQRLDAEAQAHLPASAGPLEREARRQALVDKFKARDGLALVGPSGEIAIILSGVAGLLNIMCVFDAFMLSLMGRYGEPAPEARS